VKIIFENGDVTEIDFKGKTVQDLLTKIQINPLTVLVISNKKVLTEDINIQKLKKIELLGVLSKG
jgi:sulfur carrier protein ThiS